MIGTKKWHKRLLARYFITDIFIPILQPRSIIKKKKTTFLFSGVYSNIFSTPQLLEKCKMNLQIIILWREADRLFINMFDSSHEHIHGNAT